MYVHAYECKEQGKVIHPNQTVHNHYKVCQLIKLLCSINLTNVGIYILLSQPSYLYNHVHDMIPV